MKSSLCVHSFYVHTINKLGIKTRIHRPLTVIPSVTVWNNYLHRVYLQLAIKIDLEMMQHIGEDVGT